MTDPDVPRAVVRPKAAIRTIPARVHGRYLVSPAVGSPAGVLVGFHGYGESADGHLAELRQVPELEGWTTVAIQALHRFYNRRGDVIASWMTSQDRELAVADNITYVRNVVARAIRDAHAPPRLVYAGFSQGTAMAARAAAYAGHLCDGLVLLGGDIPPEIRDDEAIRLPPVLLARGRRDEWYPQEKLERDLGGLVGRGVRVDALVYEGGHEWTDEVRAAMGRFIARLA